MIPFPQAFFAPALEDSADVGKLAQYVVTSPDCWIWTGPMTWKGYARAWIGGKRVYVHRFVYERAHGPLAANQQIDHLCRNRLCINPTHLEAVGSALNLARRHFNAMREPTGIRSLEEPCNRGHQDARLSKDGRHYICRKCKSVSQQRIRQVRRSA